MFKVKDWLFEPFDWGYIYISIGSFPGFTWMQVFRFEHAQENRLYQKPLRMIRTEVNTKF